jgi:hypothetical protein
MENQSNSAPIWLSFLQLLLLDWKPLEKLGRAENSDNLTGIGDNGADRPKTSVPNRIPQSRGVADLFRAIYLCCKG